MALLNENPILFLFKINPFLIGSHFFKVPLNKYIKIAFNDPRPT